MSAVNEAIEAVMDLIDGTGLFPDVTRGFLGSGERGIVCEIGSSAPEDVFLDKGKLVPLDLTLNAKDTDLQRLTDGMCGLHAALTGRDEYPEAETWRITDIREYTTPAIVDRQEDNSWLMASSLTVMLYLKGEI